MSGATGMKKKRNCSFCDRFIVIDTSHDGIGDDFVRLSCKCISCPKCIIKHTINRKRTPIKCRKAEHSIDTPIDKLNYFFSSRKGGGENYPIDIKNEEISIENDPNRFFSKKIAENGEEMVTKMFLNLTYVPSHQEKGKGKKYQTRSILSILDTEHGFESEKDKDQLRIMFGLLHDPIISQHRVKSKGPSTIPRMTAGQFCEYGLEKDNTMLLKLLYALATGNISISRDEFTGTPRKAPERLSNFLAICVAKGMIERVSSNAPGPLQLMMSDMLSLVNAP